MLVDGRFVAGVGSSDSHGFDQPVGVAQTVVYLGTLSASAVVAGVRGRSWLAESSAVDLALTASVAGRAEVRRLDGEPVLNPLEGVPGLAMVAMTNPVFLA